MADRICIEGPGTSSRLVRPRRPKRVVGRVVSVWSSDDDSISFSDLLLLIPRDVRAEDIRLHVSREGLGGNPHLTVTYRHVVPNTRYDRQLLEYERRRLRYDAEVVARRMQPTMIERLREDLSRAFLELDAV